MKKLLYTLLAVSIIFSACEKEEEETSNTGNNNTGNNTSSIIGKWNATHYTYDYYETPNLDTEHWVGTDDIDYWNDGHFWHIEFLTGDELQITTFGESSSGQDSLYTRNISYYTNGDDFYVLEDEWPFNYHGSTTTTSNKILLLDNTNLNFSVPCGWSENGGYGEQVIHCVRIQ